MTPEELAAWMKQQQERKQKVQQELSALQARKKKQAIYGSMGAVGGLLIGLGISKLMGNKNVTEKIKKSASVIGEKAFDEASKKIEGLVDGMFHSEQPVSFFSVQDSDNVKDAEFKVLDDEEESDK